jgi:hypothetical protein
MALGAGETETTTGSSAAVHQGRCLSCTCLLLGEVVLEATLTDAASTHYCCCYHRQQKLKGDREQGGGDDGGGIYLAACAVTTGTAASSLLHCHSCFLGQNIPCETTGSNCRLPDSLGPGKGQD